MTTWMALLCAVALLLPVELAAQRSDSRAGAVAGVVLDAATQAPLAGAAVVLQPEAAGAFPTGPGSRSAFASASRTVATNAAGAYRFNDLTAGRYRIYVSRIGYRPYSIVVDLRASSLAPVSVALTAEPIVLEALNPRTRARGPYDTGNSDAGEMDAARMRALEQRRRQFLTTDTRELTYADAVEAVTLGEPDVMRALQRMPGVTTRSDYTAELWTRGAPWSHTRVYFDGVPLYNPLHSLGIVSGIGSNAIGAVWFHPGVRPAAMAEGAAGVVDLQSRRATGAGELNVYADLSMISAALALDQRTPGGRAGWMLSGRQTYMDWLTKLARRASGSDDVAFPYAFSEVAGYVDAALGDASDIEASWLWERDHLTSLRDGEADRMRAAWGNAAGRVSFTRRFSGLHLRHTVGFSQHDATVGSDIYATRAVPEVARPARASDTGISFLGLSGTLWPEPRSLAGPAWSAGYSLERQRVSYVGPQVLPVPRLVTGDLESGDTLRMRWSNELPVAAAWVERAFVPDERLGLRAGLRVEVGPAPANTGPVRFAPRLSARYTPAPELALSMGFSRVYQYAQALAPGGVHVASLASTDVWLLAGDDRPAVRADIVTAGMEGWIADGRLATLNVFGRLSAGVATPDPRPGNVYQRGAYVEGRSVARGVELGFRQITGRLTGSAAYTLSRSDMRAAGREYAAASDRRHVLDLTAMFDATASFRTGFAFTAASGVPFTRAIADPDECRAVAGCDVGRLPWLAEPHGERAPTFASLDLLVDWSGSYRGFDIGAWVQLRNALGRENATIYTGDEPGCVAARCGDELRSAYERGVPRLPVIGLRVRH